MSNVTEFKQKISETEWQTRVDLAACFRLVHLYGWSDLLATHLSARVPDAENQFLINPFGLMFEEMTASSLVKVDEDGNELSPSEKGINPAGFVIHSAVHMARPEVACVIHTHTQAGVGVATQKDGLLPLTQQALAIIAHTGYHDYEGIALNEDEKPRLVADLGENVFLMLRNHGLLTVGQTPADAFLAMYIFEAACMIQVRALAGNRELIPVQQEILDGVREAAQVVTKGMFGGLAWPGLLRKLDRQNPGYDL